MSNDVRDLPALVLVVPLRTEFLPFVAEFVGRAASMGLHVHTEEDSETALLRAVAG